MYTHGRKDERTKSFLLFHEIAEIALNIHGTFILPRGKNSPGISCVPREESRGEERDTKLRQIGRVGTVYQLYSMPM